MPLTKAQKKEIIDIFKTVDVKTLDIDHEDPKIVKYFRFGSYNGLAIATEIIKAIKEKDETKAKS